MENKPNEDPGSGCVFYAFFLLFWFIMCSGGFQAIGQLILKSFK